MAAAKVIATAACTAVDVQMRRRVSRAEKRIACGIPKAAILMPFAAVAGKEQGSGLN
jgi:hypothetical protein